MLSKRSKTIIVIVVVVIIGLAIAILLMDESYFFTKEPVNLNINQQKDNQVNKVPQSAKDFEPVEPINQLSAVEQTLTVVARNFSEKYGSYSTDSNFTNLEEAKLLASAKLSSELQQVIDTASVDDNFYGVTSKALKVTILDLDESSGTGQVEVNMQRQETKEGMDDFVYYQKIFLSLIRSGKTWLVDTAQWQ